MQMIVLRLNNHLCFAKIMRKKYIYSNLWQFVSFVWLTWRNLSHTVHSSKFCINCQKEISPYGSTNWRELESLHLACKVTGHGVLTHHSLVKLTESWNRGETSHLLPLSSVPESLRLIFVGAKVLLTGRGEGGGWWQNNVLQWLDDWAWNWTAKTIRLKTLSKFPQSITFLQVSAEQVCRCFASWFMASTSRQRHWNTNWHVPATHFYLTS